MTTTPPRRSRRRDGARLALLSLPFLLAACGGGGGTDVTPPPPDPPPPAAVAGLRCTGPKFTGWCWQAPQPWAPVIDDVVFTDSRNGWAAADMLLRSTDGGTTWQEQALPDGAPLRAVRFANASDGWALARQGGRLWRTQDGGQTWARTAPLPLDDATGLALLGNGRLLVNGLKAGEADDSVAPFTLLSDDAAATWRTSARFVYPDQVTSDGSLWALADGSWEQSVDGGRSFTTPPDFGGSPYFRLEVPGDRSVTAWASVYDPPTGTYGKLALHLATPGGNWAPAALPPVPAADWMYGLAVLDGAGWALTGSLTNSTDGPLTPATRLTLWHRDAGATAWTSTPLQASVQNFAGHGFVDGRTAWVQTTDQAAQLSTDGGRSWAAGFPPSADATDRLQFVRRDGGGALLAGYGGDDYLSGAERWYRSTDEGRSWRALPGTAPNSDRITGLWMLDAQRGLAATSGGRWLDTANAGRDWAARADATPLPGTLQDLQFTPGGTGWVVARAEQPAGMLFSAPLSAMGPLYRSLDQGRSWAAVALPEPAAGRAMGVQFVDDRHGFLRVQTGCTSIRFHYCSEQTWSTRDGGSSWQAVGSERRQGGLLHMLSATKGVLIGPVSELFPTRRAYVTEDGGATWSEGVELPGLVPDRLVGAAGRLWLLGEVFGADALVRPQPMRTSGDGGRTWTVQAVPVPADVVPVGVVYEKVLHDMAFADDRHGWIVGRRGLVLATTDGGATWVRQASGSRQTLVTVHAPSANTVWIGGSARSILATASGGR